MSDQNNGITGRSRIHIQKRIEQADIVLNVFGNDPRETYELFMNLKQLVAGEPSKPKTTQAQRELANAELKAKLIAQQKDAKQQTEPSQTPVNAPKCWNCGTDRPMKLIRWADKETGEPRQAWKCQSCNQWWRP